MAGQDGIDLTVQQAIDEAAADHELREAAETVDATPDQK
jgi:hypothetical protein